MDELERRIESVIAQEETSATKARLLRSFPGIGPDSAAMLIAGMPELGRKMRGKPYNLVIVIVAIAGRLVTIANAILRTGVLWQHNPVT